jgi:WD40 repeat protein
MRAALVLAAALAGPVFAAAAQEPAPFGYGPLPAGAWACLGSPRFVGDTPPCCVALSPDGKLLAAGTNRWGSSPTFPPVIHVWDLTTGREVHTLRGHDHRVVALRFTPDGKKLVSAGWDNTLRVWDLARGAEESQIDGPKNAISGLELTPDGKLLISAGADGFVRVADFARGNELRRLECRAAAISLAPDGRTLAVASGVVLLWDIATGRPPRRLGPEKGIGAENVCFAPAGNTLALLDGDGRVALWDARTGAERFRLPRPARPVACLAFSADGKVLATGGHGGTGLKLWDVETGRELGACADAGADVLATAFSADGRVLVSAGDFAVRLWDWKKGREMPRFTGHGHEVTALAYAPDGRTLYSASRDGTARAWDAAAGKGRAVLRGHARGVLALGLTPDGKTLATGGADGTVRLWDAVECQALRTLADDHADVGGLAFSPDGRVLVTAGGGGIGPAVLPRVWDWRAGKERGRLTSQPGARCLAFAPDGKALAAGLRGEVSVWDGGGGKVEQRWPAHGTDVSALAYLPDGTLVSAGGGDEQIIRKGFKRRRVVPRLMTVRLWNPDTREQVYQLASAEGYHTTLAVSHDGRLIAAAFEADIHVWEASTRQQVGEFRGHRGHVSALAFSPDGRTLASGGADGAILLWDLTGHRGEGRAAAMPPVALNELWKLLGEDDGRRAVWALALAPEQAVPFLRKQVPPVPKAGDATRLRQMIADLDAVKFAARQRATVELEKLGPAAAPALRLALKENPSPELARRVQTLLEKLGPVRERTRSTPAEVQTLRAIEVLERAGTTEAREALRSIADGEPAARLTQEARAALARLDRLSKRE